MMRVELTEISAAIDNRSSTMQKDTQTEESNSTDIETWKELAEYDQETAETKVLDKRV